MVDTYSARTLAIAVAAAVSCRRIRQASLQESEEHCKVLCIVSSVTVAFPVNSHNQESGFEVHLHLRLAT